ncbi:MAG: HNH endonuclease signature motif containing protein [Clostridiales bacterium]|nr:HNH endonuclease signature motif containing protein [uncultured Intestinibacter sp.]MDU1203160.1 HNH endonuclease signature motif containing protein [Clostridiales bacterium]
MTDFIIDLMVTIWLTILIYLFLSELYFRTRGFKAIKREIEVYTKECNELNDHIEDMKSVDLGFRSKYKSNLNYSRSKKGKGKKNHLEDLINCDSRTYIFGDKRKFRKVFDDTISSFCKFFTVEINKETLEKLEKTLNDFLAVEEGKKLLERQRNEIIKKIRKELPYFIRRFTGIQRLSRKLGFKDIDLKDSYFPTYTFGYISPRGVKDDYHDFILNIQNLNELIKYLSQKIKFKKSVAGQRALMTPKLREKIKERDGYTCQICGLSNKDEPNLLLEIDHIIPLSKGGMTTEGNLQTLCWRCNRSKGAKI